MFGADVSCLGLTEMPYDVKRDVCAFSGPGG